MAQESLGKTSELTFLMALVKSKKDGDQVASVKVCTIYACLSHMLDILLAS